MCREYSCHANEAGTLVDELPPALQNDMLLTDLSVYPGGHTESSP